MKGYVDRDSIQGNPPYVTFTGLQASSHAIGSNFTFEFVSFFMNTEVRITSPPFKILPAADSLQISLWGPAPELQDPGPWMLRQQLLPITVSVMGGQGADRRVADSLIAEDRFFLVARLFNKVTSNDITASSLRGQLRQPGGPACPRRGRQRLPVPVSRQSEASRRVCGGRGSGSDGSPHGHGGRLSHSGPSPSLRRGRTVEIGRAHV